MVRRVCGMGLAWLAIVAAGSAAAADAHSQRPRMNVSVQLGEPVEPAKALRNLVTVVAPNARCAALSETYSVLAFGPDTRGAAQVALVPLDEQGKVRAGEAARATLPLPLALQNFQQYVLALAFHPSKPLLYVWRDARGPQKDHPPVDVVYNELDHLLIYSVEGGKLSLLRTGAHGRDYAFGVSMGALTVDAANGRLYVPSAQVKNPDPKEREGFFAAAGYVQLDAGGLPAADGDGLRLVVRRPLQQRYDGYYHLNVREYQNFPLGTSGPLPINDNTVVYTDKHDLITVTMDASRVQPGALKSFWLPLLEYGQAVWCRCSLHPELPVIYISGGGRLFRIEHVDGFPTLMPQVLAFNENPNSAPVVMGKSTVAVGADNCVLLFPIDAAGLLTGVVQKVAVSHCQGQALAYSGKFDRLYVAVDQ